MLSFDISGVIVSVQGVRSPDQFRQDRSNVPLPAPGTIYVGPSMYSDGEKLKVVDKFTYCFCSLDDEIALCLKKATGTFSALKDRVWD